MEAGGGSQETPRPDSERLRVSDHRAPVLPLIGIGVIASALGIALGLAIDWFPTAASTQHHQVDTFYDVLIIASVPVFVAVTSIVLYSVYRFRMKPGEEDMDGPPIHGNTRLEVIWTAIPATMMLALCVYAAIELHNAEKAPAAGPPELNVRVVGEQFAWTFYYPPENGKPVVSNQLYLPANRSVRFTVQTKDVLHDFWVPAFRWKIDAVPGINTYYRVTPTRIGTYPVVCAELCGLGHATMRQTAHVVSDADYASFLKKEASGGEASSSGGGGASTDGGAADQASGGTDGGEVFASNGCGGCHTLTAASSSGTIGPNLDTALKGQSADEIKQDIVDPNKEITKGYGANIMPPNFGQALSPEELDALVKYLQENQKG